jgi:small subunit ribosomal protein S8
MSTTSTDPIADMLTRIRNAISVNHHQVSLPHSKLKEAIAQLLVKNNYIDKVTTITKDGHKQLVIDINSESSNARISEISKLSKPGRRLYVSAREIPTVRQGKGIVIISTSSGIISGQEAKKRHIGGELICQVI